MLKDIVIAHKTVVIDDKQSFEVRGLTLTDIGLLVTDYKDPIEALMESRLDLVGIADQFPEFMAKAVAYAAGEPKEYEKKLIRGKNQNVKGNVKDKIRRDKKKINMLVKRKIAHITRLNYYTILSKQLHVNKKI